MFQVVASLRPLALPFAVTQGAWPECPETITDGFNGYLANPKDIADMVRVMNASIEKPIPRENVVEATKTMSWANYAKAVLAG